MLRVTMPKPPSHRFLDYSTKFLAQTLALSNDPGPGGTIEPLLEAERLLMAATAALRTCHEVHAGGGEGLKDVKEELQPMLNYVRVSRNWILHQGPHPSIAPVDTADIDVDKEGDTGTINGWYKLDFTLHEVDEWGEMPDEALRQAQIFIEEHGSWRYKCLARAAFETAEWIGADPDAASALSKAEMNPIPISIEISDVSRFRAAVEAAIDRAGGRAGQRKDV